MGDRPLAKGILAGTIAVGVSFALRILFNEAYLPELAASAFFSYVPGSFESAAVGALGALAKETTYVVASAILVIVLAFLPPALGRLGVPPGRRGPAAAVYALSAYSVMLGLGLLFFSLTEVAPIPTTAVSVASGMLVPGVVFGVVLAALSMPPRSPPPVAFPVERLKRSGDRKRRLFIKSALGVGAAAAALYLGMGLFSSKQAPVPAGQETTQVLSSQVTPNADFYRVDIDVFAPGVDSSTWKLNLHGLVNTPATFGYADILSLPSVEEYATLECVSNTVGGDLMSTALWKGVRLKEILDAAEVNTQADYVVFRSYDGYDVGIPLDRALADGTILAYEMNGEPLPADHGYPLRAVVPGLYGMMSAKWVTDIEVVSGPYAGFWQRRGWTGVATYQTGSTFITPGNSPLRDRFPLSPSLRYIEGEPIPLIGEAFAGDRGVQTVEVSADGGRTWQDANLYTPLSDYTWVFWRLDWRPPASGDYRLMVRAFDDAGDVQVATVTGPFPSGATGYDAVDVRVSYG